MNKRFILFRNTPTSEKRLTSPTSHNSGPSNDVDTGKINQLDISH
jgi:hypothetical protein